MKRKRSRLRIPIVVVFVVALLTFFAIKAVKYFGDIGQAFENDVPKTFSVPPEDSTIISKAYLDRLKVAEILNFKQREPISVLELDSAYYLIIARVKIKSPAVAKQIIRESHERVYQTNGEVYSILGLNNFFEFQYLSVPLEPVSNLYLTLSGDSLTSEWNDSIARFHVSTVNLSLRYGKDAPIDINLTCRDLPLGAKVKQSVDVLVLIRGYRAYFLLMTPLKSGSTISRDLLSNVVSGH